MQLLIISGRSGSGKSICLKALEDIGYNCTDNLPVSLLKEFTKIYLNHNQIAVAIDARNLPSNLLKFNDYIVGAKQHGANIKIIYLDADDATLIERFSETRRKHPLTNNTTSLAEAIALESELLTPIADNADITIHTSNMHIADLKQSILYHIGIKNNNKLSLLIQSFGFKKGVPTDADFVFDVRCLPNPYWEPELREFSGFDQEIIDYLESKHIVNKMYNSIIDFLETWLVHFTTSKNYITIAIGCTGGQHRSVYISERIAKYYEKIYPTIIRHRDIKK